MSGSDDLVADATSLIVYVALTILVLIALVFTPSQLINQTTQPIALDATIFAERINQKLSAVSAVSGVQKMMLTPDVSRALALNPTPKKYGAKVTIGRTEVYYNQEFYEDAYPLAPYKYDRFISTFSKNKNNQPILITVDQTHAQEYD